MYDLAAKSRHAMKAKIERLIDPHPGKVDSSDYGPEETDMHADRKTNVKRPINPRAYKRGGKVTSAPEGREPMRNAGKMQRKGHARGGAPKHDDAAEDKKLIDKIVKPEARRDARAIGGELYGPGAPVRTETWKNGKMIEKKTIEGTHPQQEWELKNRFDNSAKPFHVKDRETGEIKSGPYSTLKGARNSHKRDAGYKTGKTNIYDSNGRKRFKGGGTPKRPDAAEDKKLIDKIVKPEARRDARADGGKTYDPNRGSPFTLHHRESGKQVGGPYNDIKRARFAKDKKDNAYGSYAHGIRDAEGNTRLKSGGRAARSTGGDIGLGLLSPAGLAAKELLGKATGGRSARAGGGPVEYAKANAKRMAGEAMRERVFSAKTGMRGRGAEMETRRAAVAAQKLARTERAAGGRTKGKTNVNVIIATGPQGGAPMPGAMPPIGAGPVTPPMPNAAMPGTSPMPGGPLPAGLAAGAPAAMPMPRKRGGRTGYPIDTGSGGARARLDKKDAY